MDRVARTVAPHNAGDEGAQGVGSHQQPQVRPAEFRRAIAEDSDTQRPSHPGRPGRPGRVVDEGVETSGSFLDKQGIAVRAGHHCAQPTMARYGLSSMVRPSIAFYNTKPEIDALAEAIVKAKKALAK